MAAATTLAKVLRGGRSGLSSGLLPAIGRGVPQEGMHRLLHTGQWRNPMLPSGGSVKAPRKMEQFCSKRFLRSGQDDNVRLPDHPVSAMGAATFVASMLGVILTLPTIYRSSKGLFIVYKK
ncbi:unnamed protein product [Urochloa humidicola]